MEQNVEKPLLFTSNTDILDMYGEIFEKIDLDGNSYYIEKQFESDHFDIYRFFITPNGMIAVSTSTEFPKDTEIIWNISENRKSSELLLRTLDSLLEEYTINSKLGGNILNYKAFSYRIFRYNDECDSRLISMFLNERRMGYILNCCINR